MPQYQGIGTLREMSLHAALKDWYAQPGDELEVPVAGYQIDIVRDPWLIEIQTGNFSAIKEKLKDLLEEYQVRVVHPIANERWIRRVTKDNQLITQRKSPKRGRVEDVFAELVRLPEILGHPNLIIEVLLIKEEVIWRDDGRGSWRRKGWSVADRRLLEVVEAVQFDEPAQYAALLPANLNRPFTNRDLAQRLGLRRRLAEKMTYCLRELDLIEIVGKRGRFNLFSEPDHGYI